MIAFYYKYEYHYCSVEYITLSIDKTNKRGTIIV